MGVFKHWTEVWIEQRPATLASLCFPTVPPRRCRDLVVDGAEGRVLEVRGRGCGLAAAATRTRASAREKRNGSTTGRMGMGGDGWGSEKRDGNFKTWSIFPMAKRWAMRARGYGMGPLRAAQPVCCPPAAFLGGGGRAQASNHSPGCYQLGLLV